MQNKYYGAAITIVLLFVVLFVDYSFKLGLATGVGRVFTPVGVVIGDTGRTISNFFGNLANIGDLQKENAELKSKLNSAITEISAMKVAKEENDSLRRDLGFKQNSGLNLVPGVVTSFDPTLRSGINVRVENASGVVKGKPVMAEGYLIGKVAEVKGNQVKVTLTIDSLSAIPVLVSGKTITGVAKGMIGSGLVMDQVPQSESVFENDIIVTSGLGGDLPKGIVIAKVGEIQKVSGSIFQSIELLPMIDFSSIERVQIAI